MIQDVLAAVGEADLPERDRRGEARRLAAGDGLARVLGGFGSRAQEDEGLLIPCGNLVVALQLRHLLQHACKQKDQHKEAVCRLAPNGQEDVEPASDGEDRG